MPALSFSRLIPAARSFRWWIPGLLCACSTFSSGFAQAPAGPPPTGQEAAAAAESVEPLAAEDGALAEGPLEEPIVEPAPEGGLAEGVAESAAETVNALLGDGEVPAPAESAEEAAVDQAEDDAVSAPVDSTGSAPLEDVPGELGQPGDLPAPEEGENLGEDLDLIPLPEGVDLDGGFLDPPMDDGNDLLLPADIPPLDVAPALPPVPVGEPAKIIAARYKQLRIKVEKDPAVVSLWEQAQAAGTYEQQRAGLREYYRLLFKKMREEDPTLTQRINAMEQAYLRRLAQTRIEPTIPLEPPPTPEPLAPISQ